MIGASNAIINIEITIKNPNAASLFEIHD